MASNNTPIVPASAVKIVQKGSVYWVSLNIAFLAYSNSKDLSALLIWLSLRDKTETIRLSFHVGSESPPFSFAEYLPLANALEICRARTIGIVDHIFDDVSSYLLFTCDELVISDYGQIILVPLWSEGEVSERSTATTAFAHKLCQAACGAHVLNNDEYNALKSGEMVYLSPDQLRDRTEITDDKPVNEAPLPEPEAVADDEVPVQDISVESFGSHRGRTTHTLRHHAYQNYI